MARTNISRQRKPEQAPARNVDRISNLPDSLLCHILSFLPITTSVATGTLSRRWRHLWEHLQVFKFFVECSQTMQSEAPKIFIQFVNTVLILRKVHNIQKFSLSCYITDDDDDIHHEVTTWIRGATGLHLEELNITLTEDALSQYLLPESIFTCTALVSLSLRGKIDLGQLSSVRLQSLKKLELDISCANHADELLRGCPVLETLVLKFRTRPAPSMSMPPSLKRLTFLDVSGGEIDNLQMHTPSLEYVDILLEPTACCSFSASDLHNVVEAHLHIFPHVKNVKFVSKLLNMLYRTRYLKLKVETIRCLLDTPKLDLPQFCYLVCLHLEFPSFNSRFGIDLLHCCSGLQILRIEGQEVNPSCAPWTEPTCAPYCLMFQLIRFVFRRYRDSADEHAFVAYVLKKGQVLKTVEIYSHNSMDMEKRHHVLKGLSAIPRGSINCQLVFD